MFSKKCDQLFTKLGDHQIMCLATSLYDIVTARSMSIIIYNRKFYFQTDSNFVKYKQLCGNQRAALCWNNIQIEGICKEIGSPLSPKNLFFVNLGKHYFNGTFEMYSAMKGEVLFELEPIKVSVWDCDDDKPFQELFDFQNQTYHKEYYHITE